MVAIVAGNGLGLFNASLNTLGGGGAFGQSSLGQASGQSYVNASNGNLVLRFNDEQLSGLSQELMHLRTYNAQGTLSDADADGWRWDGERKLVLSGTRNATGSTVTRTTGDGHQTVYAWNGSRYASSEGDGAHDSLVGTNSLLLFPSDWVWTDGSTRATENYDLTTGRLKSYTNPNGEKTTYSYDGNGRLSSIKDSSGQELVLVYNAANRLERLDTRTTSGGALTRQVYYAYDASGRLTSVTTDLTPSDNSIADGKVYTTSYSYDGASFRIAGISQSDGTSVAYTYQLVGSEYRVKTVVDASGTTAFAYDTANRRTDISNGLGQLWSYYYDAAGQLTQVLSPAVNGQRLSTSYSYDAQGNVTSIKDGAGNTVTYGYDANGNRTLERDALGDTIIRVYSSANQLQNEIRYTVPATNNGGVWTNPPDAAAQVTRFVYDAKSNLRYVIDAVGVVSESRYNSDGLRIKTLQYRDATYAVSGLAPAATLSESQLNTWVTSREVAKVGLTDFTYDYRGNLTKSVSYASVGTNSTGIMSVGATLTEYVYSEHGQLLQTIAVRGANRNVRTTLSSMVYDGLGRLQSQVDADGTQTTTYSGGARQIAVANTAGQIVTQTYDAQGRLVSVSQTASGETTRTTQYVYDAAGRLRMVQDPTGVRSYTFYDEAGRVSARVDGTGALAESVYTAAGQLTQEKRYAVRLDTSSWYNGSAVTKMLVSEIRPTTANAADRSSTRTYDTAGRLSTVVDGIGTVTSYSYDGRNQLIQVQTGNRVTRTFYDAAGRQSGQLDGEGYLRENIYDAVGQLSRVIRYSIVTTEANRATGTLAQLRPAATGALTTWYYYDNVGRQIGSVDEQGFVTESVYDEALNTLQSLRYATPYTASITTSTTFSSIRTAVSGGAKQTTLTAFDSMGRVAQQTAQDGTVTAYEYDTAGRLVKETAASGTAEARLLTTRYNAFGEVTGRLMGEASARIVPGMTTAQITAIYDQYGLTWSYDAAGRQVSVRDAFGNKTVSYYDEAGRLTHVVNALGEVKESLYNAFGEVKEQTGINTRLSAANVASLTGGLNATINPLVAAIKATAKDNKTIFSYDTRGLLTSKTDALGYLTSIGYNAYGEQASVSRTMAAGVTSTENYAYSRRGELLTRTEDQSGLNRVTSTAYDAFGRVISRIDGRGLITTTNYDLNGRKITVKDPLNQSRSSEYDAWGRALTEIDAKGLSTTYNYDDVTRTITVNLPEAVTLRTVRNRHGEVASSTDGELHATQFQYDKDGQLTVTLDARNQQALNTYDKGRLVSVTDVRGGITRYGYDAAGRVVTRTDALGVVTQYDFDALGQQVRVTEALGKPEQRVTAYAYDLKGQLLTVTQDPDGLKLTTTYGYDGVGQQVRVARGTMASPDQQVVLYVYDKLGRRTAERQDPTGLNITTQYRYNGNDQVTRKIDGLNNSAWYVYDNAGRLTDTVNALGAVTRNLYDANGKIISTTRYATALPAATVDSFASMDQLVSVSPTANSALDQVTTFAYDGNGRLKSTTDALGKTESYTYDKAGNRISLTNKNGSTWNYRYDELNRLTEEITPVVTVSTLSSSGQLSSQSMLLVTSMAYDAAGNVISRMEGRQRASLTAVAGNDDLSQARETKYLYDAVGRQTTIIAPGAYNKITGAYQQTSDGTSNTFQVTTEVSYDALGNAVRNRVRVDSTGVAANDYIDSYKTYDIVGRVTHEIDALNGVTLYGYDALANVLTMKRHANALNYAVPTRGYYLASEITAARLVPDAANDRTLTMTFDAVGRKSSVQRNLVNIYTTSTSTLLQGAPTTLYSYDAMGRVTKETQVVRNATGGTIQTGASLFSYYDKVGNQVGSVDAMGYLTRNSYDALGQLQLSIQFSNKLGSWGEVFLPSDPAANSNDRRTAYGYDRLGRVTNVTLENVKTWRFGTTGNNYYTATVAALSAVEVSGDLVVDQRTYDNVGNILTLRDAADNVTTMGYNALGQMISLIEPARLVAKANQINSFENDIAQAVSASPQTTYALNAFGQIISETRSPGVNQAGWIQIAKTRFDAAGHEIQSIDAANASIDYKVDVAGRRVESRQQVSAQFNAWTGNTGYAHELRQRYGYDKLGQQLFTQDYYISASGESFSSKSVLHNRFGEIYSELSIGLQPSDGLSIALVASYVYDQAGRVIRQQNNQGVTTLDYDMADRVSRSTQLGDGTTGMPDRVTRTEYDAGGRATRQYQSQFETSAVTNPLTSVSTTVTTPTINQTYDRWGNVLSRTDQRGYVTQYTYDHENRVLTETLPQTNILRADGSSYRASLIQERRYDAIGNVLHEVDWVGPYAGMSNSTQLRSKTHAYNAVSELVRDIDALGVSRYYMVDANGNRVTTRDALAKVYINTFDAMDRQLTNGMMLKNSNGVLEHRVIQTSKYDQAGRKYAEINGTTEVEESYGADRYNQMTVGTVRYSVYDQRGNIIRTNNESSVERAYEFDVHNRKVKETHLMKTAGQVDRYMTWGFDNGQYGRLSTHRDLDGRQYTFTYNTYGQLAKESLNGIAALDKTYEYYTNGMLKKVSEGVLSYNTAGAVILQEKRSSTYVYDAAGNRVRETDATQTNLPSTPNTIKESSSAEARYNYDEQGRLIGVIVPTGNTHLVGIANSSSNYTVANAARINTLTYDYDEVGNRRRTAFNTTNQSGAVVNKERWFTYDKEGRVLLGDALMVSGALQYVYQNGESVGYENTYDVAGRLINTFTNKGTGTYVVSGVTYSGNIYDVSRNYYDDQDRLYSVEAAYFTKSSTGQWQAPTTVKGAITGGVTVTNAIQIRMRSSYDGRGNLLGNISRSFKPDGTVESLVGSSWLYRGDGKVVLQFSIDERSNSFSYQDTYFNDVGAIDGQGNQLKYRVDFKGDATFTNTYTKTYAAYDGYKELTTAVSSTRSGFTPGLTTNTYSQRGEMMQVVSTGGTPLTRQFASNREGLVISRREVSSNKVQNYVYYKGAEVASIGNANAAELSDALAMTWRSDYVAGRPSSYAVNTGDTLASIARQLWGDSRMWYLIADANGLAVGANDPLESGALLRIPAVVGSTQNNATTFKPYNPAEIIGDNTPNPNAPPPPKKKCGGLATIIMVVVAVVAVVVTAGAAAVALAPTGTFAAGTAFSAIGASALTGGVLTAGVGAWTVGAAAVIGGAVGSAISQGVGMAMGVVDKFSWRQVAAGGIGAGLTAGLGHFGQFAQITEGMKWSQAASAYAQNAAMSYSVNQLSGRVAGLDTSFSWRSVASTVVGATIGNAVGRGLGIDGTNLWSGVARSVITGSSQGYFNQQWARGGKLDFVQLAMDSFGNALGNYVVGQMQPKAAALAAQAPATQDAKSTDGRLAANIFDRAAYERAIGVDMGSGGVLDAMPYEVWRARQIAQYGGDSLNEKAVLSDFGFVGADELGIPTLDGWQEKPWLGVVPSSSPVSGLLNKEMVWQELNSKFGSDIDFGALSRFEGGQKLQGYIPMTKGGVLGQSGATIATGFDVGQYGRNEIKAFGFPDALEEKILPFAGLRKGEALAVMDDIKAIGITSEEANIIDYAVKAKHLGAAIRSWDGAKADSAPAFTDLTKAQQTVIFSRTFHQGVGMPNAPVSQAFYSAAQAGQWQSAEAALRNYNVSAQWYKNRVSSEANLLRAERGAH